MVTETQKHYIVDTAMNNKVKTTAMITVSRLSKTKQLVYTGLTRTKG